MRMCPSKQTRELKYCETLKNSWRFSLSKLVDLCRSAKKKFFLEKDMIEKCLRGRLRLVWFEEKIQVSKKKNCCA